MVKNRNTNLKNRLNLSKNVTHLLGKSNQQLPKLHKSRLNFSFNNQTKSNYTKLSYYQGVKTIL